METNEITEVNMEDINFDELINDISRIKMEKINNIKPIKGTYYFNIIDIVNDENQYTPRITTELENCSIDLGRRFDTSIYTLFNNMLYNGPNYLLVNKLLPEYTSWIKLACCKKNDNTCSNIDVLNFNNIDFLWISEKFRKKLKLDIQNKNIKILFRNRALVREFVTNTNDVISNSYILNNKNLFYNVLKEYNDNIIPKYWVINFPTNSDIKDFTYINERNLEFFCKKYATMFVNYIRYNIVIGNENNIINKMLLLKFTNSSLGYMIYGLIIKANTNDAYKNTISNLTKELFDDFSNPETLEYIKTKSFFEPWQLSYFIKPISFDNNICTTARNNMKLNSDNILYTIDDIPALKVRYYVTIFSSNDVGNLEFSMILHRILDADILPQYVLNNDDIYDRLKFISNIHASDIHKKLYNTDLLINNENYKNYQLFLYNCFNLYYCTKNNCGNKSNEELPNFGVLKLYNQEKNMTIALFNTLYKLYGINCTNNYNKIESCFEIFAIDVIIDIDLNIKILEINNAPVVQGGYPYFISYDIYTLIFEKVIIGNGKYNKINDIVGIIEHDNYFYINKNIFLDNIIKTTSIKADNYKFLIEDVIQNVNQINNDIISLKNDIITIIKDLKKIDPETLSISIIEITVILTFFNAKNLKECFNELNEIYQKYSIIINPTFASWMEKINNNFSNFYIEYDSISNIFNRIYDLTHFYIDNKSKIIVLNDPNISKEIISTMEISKFMFELDNKVKMLINSPMIDKIVRYDDNNNEININISNEKSGYTFSSLYTSEIIMNFLNNIKNFFVDDYNRYYNIYEALKIKYNLNYEFNVTPINNYNQKNFYKKYMKYKSKYLRLKNN